MTSSAWIDAALTAGRLEITATPDLHHFTAILDALERETAPVVGDGRPQPLAVLLRDDAGSVAGGLWGCTIHAWLTITLMFVPPPLRGHGVGTALVRLAEATARARGCIGVQVDAYEFQAAGFYQRLGFEAFGVQENNPPGHRRIFFARSLTE